MKKYLLSLLLTGFTTLIFGENNALLHDIIAGKYKPQTLPEMVALSDGEHYAQLQENNVISYSYKTGQAVDTLFAIAHTKGTKLEQIDGFILAPAGKYLLVYNNMQKVYRRSFTADYYIYDTERYELRPLSAPMPVMQPVFSPNGKYIAFSRQNNLYVHKLDFGTEVAVTTDGEVGKIINGTPDWLYEEEFDVTCLYAFSPDNKQLAFVRFDETEVPTFTWQDMLTNGYPEAHSLKYPRAGENNAQVSVVVYDMQYKSLKTMQIGGEEDAYIPRIRWTNSADQLAIFRLNRNQNKLEMLLANPKSTVCKRSYYEESKDAYIDYAQIDEWQFLSDNSYIVINETDGYRNIYHYSSTGQKLRQLTAYKYDITRLYGYHESTATLYYQAADQSPMTRTIYALQTKKNRLTALTTTEGTHQAHFSPTFSYFIDNYSSLTTPNRYTLCDNTGKPLWNLLHNNEVEKAFSALHLPQKEFFSFTTARGDKLNGWMLLPQHFDVHKKYPVLQVQYSGPNSQQVLDRWKIDWEYFLATQGIIVVCVDGRGTGARGRAFRTSTYQHIGIQEAEDQVAVAQYMQTLPYVQADKIGIWGWSYGGFMTLLSMSQPEAIFACGIAVAPVTDFRFYDSAYTERFMRRPQTNESGYNACALPYMAAQLHGQLLIVHGLADDNVHCQNTWNYIDALVQADKQFEMQVYPDDNHFLRKRNNYAHLYERMWIFLQQNLLQ